MENDPEAGVSSAVELDKGPQFYLFCSHFKMQHFARFSRILGG